MAVSASDQPATSKGKAFYLQNSLLLMFKWSIKVFRREASLSSSTSSEVLEPRELLGLTTDDSFHLAALFLEEVVDKVDIVDSFFDDLQC